MQSSRNKEFLIWLSSGTADQSYLRNLGASESAWNFYSEKRNEKGEKQELMDANVMLI
jgi:hypothetical protein